jgi:hypothetical protein
MMRGGFGQLADSRDEGAGGRDVVELEIQQCFHGLTSARRVTPGDIADTARRPRRKATSGRAAENPKQALTGNIWKRASIGRRAASGMSFSESPHA